MYKALLSKEWLKTRRVFLIALAVGVLVDCYVILEMKSLAQARGMGSLWLAMIQKDVSFVSIITYIPLIIGIAVGVAQMAPEMSQKRLKLTLHLPVPTFRLIAVMIGTGVLELFVIFIAQMAIIAIYDATILPPELVGRVMLTMLPWCLGGIIAYIFVAAICLEGKWTMRGVLAALGTVTVALMYQRQDAMAAYTGMLGIIVILIFAVAALAFGSVARFKEGLQD